ncbi:MAG: PLP-dependent transferase [Spirochaetaceae bacterium]|nr:PLP-dependent transferase [Spirochaetaceae bacterium]
MSTGAPPSARPVPARSDQELLDLVDADNTVIGTVDRSRVHGAPALRHRAVHVLVYDDRGHLLLQKRSAGKEIQPGKWDTSVGGHLESGESYPAAAVRETAEELGLAIDVDALVPVHGFVWRSPMETEHVTSYRIHCGGPFRPHPEEIDELRFWSAEQLRAAAGTGALTPMLEHELALLGVLPGSADAGTGVAPDPAYLDPGTGAALPAEPPPRAAMNPATRSLHDAIDATMRRLGQPYLHPDGETLQLDLFGSEAMVRWQERKAAAVFLAAEAWSDLPQTYGRYGTESGRLLLAEVRRLEHAAGALLTDGGMQACALACDVLFAPGSHAVVTRSVYNKTKSYLQRLAARQGGQVTLVDDGDLDAIERALRPDTTVLFTETYTNPHTRAVDPPALAAVAARARGAGAGRLRVVVDNTIATPWGLREPLLSVPGIDVVVASGTKALAGQDRDMWGYVASNHIDVVNEAMDLQAMRGGILDWRRARAILAGLEGARGRFERRCATAAAVARFLAGHPRVAQVLHPSLPEHPDAAAVARHYRLPGSMVSFRIRNADEDATRHFCDVLAMTGVPRYALSFDGLATKINHHRSVSEYFTAEAEVRRIGVDRLVRLGIGVEDEHDLAACLNWALWRAPEVTADSVAQWQARRRRALGIS